MNKANEKEAALAVKAIEGGAVDEWLRAFFDFDCGRWSEKEQALSTLIEARLRSIVGPLAWLDLQQKRAHPDIWSDVWETMQLRFCVLERTSR